MRCPNVIPPAECVDPNCTYCRIAREEGPRRLKLIHWPPGGADTLYHWCPACEKLHVVPPNRWTRTGPDDCPSYQPSFLQYDVKKVGDSVWGNCHYFIREGHIQFCGDSWHGRTDTVPMPDVPESVLANITAAVFEQ